MSSNDDIDWEHLTFDDLDRIDWENIPVQHVKAVTDLMCLRRFHNSTNGLSEKDFAELSGQHRNNAGAKLKGKRTISNTDMIWLSALTHVPKEDLQALKQRGKVSLKKIWELFK